MLRTNPVSTLGLVLITRTTPVHTGHAQNSSSLSCALSEPANTKSPFTPTPTPVALLRQQRPKLQPLGDVGMLRPYDGAEYYPSVGQKEKEGWGWVGLFWVRMGGVTCTVGADSDSGRSLKEQWDGLRLDALIFSPPSLCSFFSLSCVSPHFFFF